MIRAKTQLLQKSLAKSVKEIAKEELVEEKTAEEKTAEKEPMEEETAKKHYLAYIEVELINLNLILNLIYLTGMIQFTTFGTKDKKKNNNNNRAIT